jgi:hypothetical protein
MRWFLVIFCVLGCQQEGLNLYPPDAGFGPQPDAAQADAFLSHSDLGADSLEDVRPIGADLAPDTVLAIDTRRGVDVEEDTGSPDLWSPLPDLASLVDLRPMPPDLRPEQRPVGTSCTSNDQCQGSHCVSSVCCSAACEGGCYTGCGANGQCTSCNTCSCSGMTGQCHC